MSYFEQKNSGNSISRPQLICIIQNFHLQHLTENGRELRGSEWIHQILEQMDQSNNGTSSFHKQFTDFFSTLDVKTLPFPVSSLGGLGNLSALPDSDLNPGYASGVQDLWKHIISIAGPKRIGGLRMTGSALARLVEKWTEGVNVPIGDFRANSAAELLEHIM